MKLGSKDKLTIALALLGCAVICTIGAVGIGMIASKAWTQLQEAE